MNAFIDHFHISHALSLPPPPPQTLHKPLFSSALGNMQYEIDNCFFYVNSIKNLKANSKCAYVSSFSHWQYKRRCDIDENSNKKTGIRLHTDLFLAKGKHSTIFATFVKEVVTVKLQTSLQSRRFLAAKAKCSEHKSGILKADRRGWRR